MIIQETGPYWSILKVDDEERVVFNEGNDGPFYLTNDHQIWKKYYEKKGEWKVVNKTKQKIEKELKGKGCNLRCHILKEELEQLSDLYKIERIKSVEVVEEG